MMTNNDREAGYTARLWDCEHVNSRGAAVWEQQEHALCKSEAQFESLWTLSINLLKLVELIIMSRKCKLWRQNRFPSITAWKFTDILSAQASWQFKYTVFAHHQGWTDVAAEQIAWKLSCRFLKSREHVWRSKPRNKKCLKVLETKAVSSVSGGQRGRWLNDKSRRTFLNILHFSRFWQPRFVISWQSAKDHLPSMKWKGVLINNPIHLSLWAIWVFVFFPGAASLFSLHRFYRRRAIRQI